jgi:hypothetical protein
MDIIKTAHKGKILDVLERFFMYKTSKRKPVMSEQLTTNANVLFGSIVNRDRQKKKGIDW